MSHRETTKLPGWAMAALGAIAGFALFFLVAVDPLDIHPLDTWLGFDRSVSDPAAPEREVLFYRNPMDPTITSPVPAKDEMGMDYLPVYADGEAATMTGANTVSIDPAVVQNINVRTEVAERRSLGREIRTVGTLEFDQERMTTVTPKYTGWVEKVYVNYVGEPVRRGQALFEIYSPELVQTQQELLSAMQYAEKFDDTTPDARRRAAALVEAARTRLSYWDVSPRQVARLEEDGEIARTLTVVAPTSGVVMKRMPGLEGMAVQPGMEMYHIANLSSLWLSVDLFEEHLAFVGPGTQAAVTLDYLPGETFSGVVRFLEPSLSEQTRTLKAKVEIDNRSGKLRPGMFATVVLEPGTGIEVVAVPANAVVRTGRRNVVLVALGDGRFEAREVVLGRSSQGYSEIVSGLSEGESVAVSSQFLLDSEANIQAVIQRLSAASSSVEMEGMEGMEGMDHAGHDMSGTAMEPTAMELMGMEPTDSGPEDHFGHDMPDADSDQGFGDDREPSPTEVMDHSHHDMNGGA